MRIISGRLGGRIFTPPMNQWPTRPTTDRAREALFNILSNRLDFTTIRAADLFGGTGAHTLEIYSRGSDDVTYVDEYRPAVAYMRKLINELDISSEITVIQDDVLTFLEKENEPFDYLFADPPFDYHQTNQLPEKIFSSGLLKSDGLFVLEHDQRHDFSHFQNFKEVRKYGTVYFSFFGK